MPLIDVRLKSHANRKGILIGIIFVLVGSGLSVIPVYGLLLSAILGSIGILVAGLVPTQKDDLVKTSSQSLVGTASLKEDNIGVRDNKEDSKTEDINKERQ